MKYRPPLGLSRSLDRPRAARMDDALRGASSREPRALEGKLAGDVVLCSGGICAGSCSGRRHDYALVAAMGTPALPVRAAVRPVCMSASSTATELAGAEPRAAATASSEPEHAPSCQNPRRGLRPQTYSCTQRSAALTAQTTYVM